MALSKASLKSRIVTELTAQGFNLASPYSYATKMAEAIANAVVDEITTNAVTSTTGVTGVGAPGGPLPITAQPGVVT